MNKLKFVVLSIIFSVLLSGCERILEPVSFYGKSKKNTQNEQENFSINTIPLTFLSAKKANNDPYLRNIMQNGLGAKANVLNEKSFLKAKFPPSSKKSNYLIGIGDKISFTLQNEFIEIEPQWPKETSPTDYLLGIGDEILFTLQNKFIEIEPQWPKETSPTDYLIGFGDELTFVQQNESKMQDLTIALGKATIENVLSTQGIVGTNGNILLLGLGNINVGNRSLAEIRTEVRNILIRDGFAPNFQLEISKFKSKKVFVSSSDGKNKTFYINNLPVTLQETVINAGISQSAGNNAIITLVRGNKNYRMTAKQLMSSEAPNIYIQDKDIIAIRLIENDTISSETTVDSQGNILLPYIGSIKAKDETISNIQQKVANILTDDELKPNFQLEISKFKSKKVFVSSSDGKNKTFYINNLPVTLQETVINAGISQSAGNNAIITLVRGNKNYRMTAKQLMSSEAPNIYIQDKDIIAIRLIGNDTISSETTVDSQGNILLPYIGSIKAKDETISNIQQKVANILTDDELKPNFQLEITKFKSKNTYLILGDKTKLIPLTDKNITIRDLLISNSNNAISSPGLVLITLRRNGKEYQFTKEQIYDSNNQDVYIQDNDQIEVEKLKYKPGQVFVLSGSGNAKIVPVNPAVRETLADVLFVENGALNNNFAKRSEVYLLRGRNPSKAYHLNAQNVSRILVAAKTELRPNDIIFVAERPIISFARTLAEISPLRILLRDIQEDKIP